jgi:hypothetical protein
VQVTKHAVPKAAVVGLVGPDPDWRNEADW